MNEIQYMLIMYVLTKYVSHLELYFKCGIQSGMIDQQCGIEVHYDVSDVYFTTWYNFSK